MARQRTMEEQAERREAQRRGREQARSGRGPARDSYFAQRMRGLVPIFTTHPGSKRGASHRPSAAADVTRSKAHTWSVVTGRPLPPAARIRTDKVSNAVPMPNDKRQLAYVLGRMARTDITRYGPRPETAAQRRRRRHKLGHQLAGIRRGTKTYTEVADEYLALRPDVT